MTKPGPDRTATDENILIAIRDHYAPAVGTSDIAETVGVARQTVDLRLRDLLEEGYVDSTKIGRSRIWWLTSKGRRSLSNRDGH